MKQIQIIRGLLVIGLALLTGGCATTGSGGLKLTEHFRAQEATVKIPFEGDFAEVRVSVHNFPANIHANNGVAALRTEQWDTAVEELKQAVAERTDKASFHFALAVAHEVRGHYPEAEHEYNEAKRCSGEQGMFDVDAGLKRLAARRK